MAKELGKVNISVNAICPGFVKTDMNSDKPAKVDSAKKMSVLSYEYAIDDMVNFLILICSDKMMGVSGRVFNLDSRIL